MRVEILALTMLGASLLVPVAGWSQSSQAQTQQQAIKEMQERARQAAEARRKQLQQQQQLRQQQRQQLQQQQLQQLQQLQQQQIGRQPPQAASQTAVSPSAAAAGGPPGAAPAEPLTAKVDQAVMGPRISNGQMTPLAVSDDGDHIAIVAPKGSRQVVLVDGVEGPIFDDVPRGWGAMPGAIRLSPTGGHSAYVGRRGQDYIAVIDGKEAGEVATQQASGAFPFNGAPFDFYFNRDGSHLVYPVVNDTGSVAMVIDGVKGQTWPALDLAQTSVKGNRIAYVAQTNDQMWHFVVDGKPGPGRAKISSVMMTADGKHYVYVAQTPSGTVVVADGVEGKAYQNVSDLEMAPDGRIAYIGWPNVLVLPGGQEVQGAVAFAQTAPTAGAAPQHYVALGGDGKSIAYVKRNTPSPGVVAVVNGKAGLEYNGIGYLQFSPDGRRYFYMAATNAGNFPVVDGEEMAAVTGVTDFQFSPDSKRYVYKIWSASQGFSVMVDGKESPHYRQDVMGIRFSPDSKHIAYGAMADNNLTADQAVIDGEVRPGYVVAWVNPNQTNPPVIFPPFFYSPDGNHVAYVGQRPDGTGRQQAVVIDGVAHDGASLSFGFPDFSPDSKHFAWINTTSEGWVVFIDEKIGPAYDGIVQSKAGARFIDDHTYRYYGVKDNQVYRVTIDLGG